MDNTKLKGTYWGRHAPPNSNIGAATAPSPSPPLSKFYACIIVKTTAECMGHMVTSYYCRNDIIKFKCA